jgi:prepilin-type N-terminal cleavage/methylation domain-containing protein
MADRPRHRVRAALAREDGFTLFELLMAITVLAVGLMALVSSFDHSRDLVSTAEKTEIASHRAERELERILALPYADVEHGTTPLNSPNSADPAYYVSAGNYQYDQVSTGPQAEPETLVAVQDGGTDIPSTASTWTDSETRLTGQIQSFVTWTGDYCTAADRTRCAKRVTVAVTVGGPRPLSRPVLISTIRTSPAGAET